MSISPLLVFLFLLSISLWQIDKKTISFVLAHEKQLYENSLRAKALAIVHSCISMLGSMSGVYKVGYFLFTIKFFLLFFTLWKLMTFFYAERYSQFDEFDAWSTNRAILPYSKFPSAVPKSWWLEHADGGIYVIQPLSRLNARITYI